MYDHERSFFPHKFIIHSWSSALMIHIVALYVLNFFFFKQEGCGIKNDPLNPCLRLGQCVDHFCLFRHSLT